MDTEKLTSRRRFLHLTGGLAAGVVLPAIPSAVQAAQKEGAAVNPMEDLMNEHGVLRRVLLIYDETANRIRSKTELPPGVVENSANIVLHFIHNYHERLEEEEIFPRFTSAGRLTDLVSVLSAQHLAGRRLTESILQFFKPPTIKPQKPKAEEKKIDQNTPAAVQQIYGGTPFITHLLGKETTEMKMTESGVPHSQQSLLVALEQFAGMYRPHCAREDTVLFPAFHSIVSPREFAQLGENFKNRQRELFGEHGFGKMTQSVADIEKQLGIYDLSKFTA